MDLSPVDSVDGLREREDDVFACPVALGWLELLSVMGKETRGLDVLAEERCNRCVSTGPVNISTCMNPKTAFHLQP